MSGSKEEEKSVFGLTIGQIATKTGTSVETLRYYEKFGLLAAPERTSANYRLFPQETIRVVKFIKKAQDLGFTLKDIKQLLLLYNSPDASDEEVKAISLALLKDIDTRINTLNTMRTSLGELVAQCAGEHPVKHCPILNALDV